MRTTLALWNTLGKTTADVRPQHPDGVVRVYHCGPTVYGLPHLGNIRRFLVADLLVRTLTFLGYRVRSVMNITDVGHLLDADHASPGMDRMVLASQRERASPAEVAAKYTREFFTALTLLRAEPAQQYPRATMHIPQMIALTQRLVQRGVAYETSSGVYLDVTKVPSYGALSGNTLDALEAGARVDVREEKRHPADFALWVRAPQEHLMQWDSPWGRGYPGWHIECSAMALHALGETLDIHTGGEDNIFPHHENERAQSESATGLPFAVIWSHNAHLLVNEKKMSKSEGTFITLPELLERGYSPLTFRLLTLQTHYRSRMNFTWLGLDAAAEALRTLHAFVRGLSRSEKEESPASAAGRPAASVAVSSDLAPYVQAFTEALARDLGSPQALAVVFDLVRAFNPAVNAGTLSAGTARRLLDLLRRFDSVLAILDVDTARGDEAVPAAVRVLVEQRERARVQKDFAAADVLRKKLLDLGYTVDDTPAGPRLTTRPAP